MARVLETICEHLTLAFKKWLNSDFIHLSQCRMIDYYFFCFCFAEAKTVALISPPLSVNGTYIIGQLIVLKIYWLIHFGISTCPCYPGSIGQLIILNISMLNIFEWGDMSIRRLLYLWPITIKVQLSMLVQNRPHHQYIAN